MNPDVRFALIVMAVVLLLVAAIFTTVAVVR